MKGQTFDEINNAANGDISYIENAYTDCLTEIYGKVPVLENAYKAIIAMVGG